MIPDVLILGGGIVGTACALDLARAGARVNVLERDTIGSGATAAGMGHVVVMDDSPAQFDLTRYSQSLWEELAPELPPAVEYTRSGTLWVAADDQEMAEVHRKHAYCLERSIPAEVLDSHSLALAEPNLRPSLAGALLVPGDAVLYPPSAAAFLMREAIRLGARLTVASAVSASHGRVTLADGSHLQANIIINATGAHAPALTPGIQLRKRKGHLLITDRYPGFIRHQIVELGYLKGAHATTADTVAFNVQPRPNGQVLVGSSRQYNAESTGVDQKILTAMLDRAALYMPSLPSLSALRIWTGFRAATPDKLPLIGPTEDPTVYLATGHEGLGITTSLATARLLADHLLRRPSAIPIEPYLPGRVTHPQLREVARV